VTPACDEKTQKRQTVERKRARGHRSARFHSRGWKLAHMGLTADARNLALTGRFAAYHENDSRTSRISSRPAHR
jgi:hypothetical protein